MLTSKIVDMAINIYVKRISPFGSGVVFLRRARNTIEFYWINKNGISSGLVPIAEMLTDEWQFGCIWLTFLTFPLIVFSRALRQLQFDESKRELIARSPKKKKQIIPMPVRTRQLFYFCLFFTCGSRNLRRPSFDMIASMDTQFENSLGTRTVTAQ